MVQSKKMVGFKHKFFLFLGLLILPIAVFSAHDDVGLFSEKVSIPDVMLEGKKTRFYATTNNLGTEDVKGIIRFFTAGEQIGADQPVSIVAGKEDTVFIDAELVHSGNYEILIRFFPFDSEHDDPNNNAVTQKVAVVGDADRDGKPDSTDPDDDNDGIPDEEDAFPLNFKESKDSDGDGAGDNRDTDDDNDGIPDETDCAPLDAKESKDADGDKVCDKNDVFPNDPKESADLDRDGVGNKSDLDADGDGISKETDKNDMNLGPEITFTGLQTFLTPNETVTIDLSKIKDPDGEVKNIAVSMKVPGGETFDPLAISENNTLTVPMESLGKYELKVTAIDNKGESREETFELTVRNPATFMGILFVILLAGTLAIFGLVTYSAKRSGKKLQRKKR